MTKSHIVLSPNPKFIDQRIIVENISQTERINDDSRRIALFISIGNNISELKSKEEKRSKSIITCGLGIVFLIKNTLTSNKRFPKAKI